MTDLLERDRDLEVIGRAVAAQGAVAILGPPGVGKSELLAAAGAAAGQREQRVLTVRASELHRSVPLSVARELVDALDRRLPGAPERAGGAASILARDTLDVDADPAALTAAGDRAAALAHGLLWLLRDRAAQHGPLVLAIDDLQWCDDPTLTAVLHLARHPGDGVALLVALRQADVEQRPELAELLAAPGLRVVRPAPLSPDATGALLRTLLPGASDATARACVRSTGGNPFLVRELAHALAERGGLPTPQDVEALVPDAVLRQTTVRLRTLGEDAVAVARAVAVLGSAPLRVVAEMVERSVAAVEHAVETLAAADLLVRADPTQIAHPLLASAIRDEAGPLRCGRLNAAAAVAIERAGGDPQVIAAHLARAPVGAVPAAGERLVAAARLALRANDPAQALTLAARALEEPMDDDARDAALALRSVAAVSDGRAREIDPDGAVSRSGRADAALALAREQYWRGDHARAVELAERGLAAEADDRTRALLEELRLAASMFVPGRFELPARAETPAALAIAATYACGSGATPQQVRALTDRVLAALRDRSGDAHDLLAEAFAVSFSATPLVWADELDAAEEILAIGRARSRGAGSLTAFSSVAHTSALVCLRRGRLTEGLAHARDALAIVHGGWGLLDRWAPLGMVRLQIALGDLQAARAALPALRESAPRIEDALTAKLHGVLAAEAGAHGEALEHFEAAGREAQRWGMVHPGTVDWRPRAALSAHALGDQARAAAHAQEAVEIARRVAAPGPLARALRAQAQIARQVEPAQEAEALLRESPLRLDHAEALVDLGMALRRAGRTVSARPVLREGLALAESLGAQLLAARATEELRAAGGRRVARRASSGAEALTGGELRVASLAARGHTNREIAASLVVTVKTVEGHLASAYRKLGIRGRAELAAALPDRALAAE